MTPPTTAELRAWARAQGMDVGDRGRLSPQVRAAWDAAHAATPAPEPPTEPLVDEREAEREAVEQRFADLERQVGELARRVAQLERAATATPRRRRFGRRE